MKRTKVAIYGAGGFGREVAWLVESCTAPGHHYEVSCFIVDDPANHGQVLNDVEIVGLDMARHRYPDAVVVGAIGSPHAREKLMTKAEALGFRPATLVHPRVEHSRWLDIGEGTVICTGCILTTNIQLGRHVQINLDCTVGHDVVMSDYATLAPGVHVSGRVHLGRRVYVGTGAVLINGQPDHPLIVGDDAVIGAGACVVKSVPAAATVVGVPAKEVVRH